jgi:DNA-binding PadR family transcriptional regulator
MNIGMGYWDPQSGKWGWYGRTGRRGMKRLRRGALKLAILKLLSELPRHGYDLMREVREKGWGGGAGSIYPLLGALEAAGLIKGRDDEGRRVYETTEQGRKLLGEHADELERLLNADRDEEATEHPATHVRESAARLMQAISQLDPSSKSETLERVRQLLDGARKEIYTLLAQE